MDATQVPDALIARPQIEMISIAEHQSRTQRVQIPGRHRFDGGLGADRSKDRGIDLTVRGV